MLDGVINSNRERQGIMLLSAPPPEKVLLIAPIIEDVLVVLKKFKKCGDAITSVITPES